MLSSEVWHKQLILARMEILPKTDVGMGKRLCQIIGSDAGDCDPVGKLAGQEFLQRMAPWCSPKSMPRPVFGLVISFHDDAVY